MPKRNETLKFTANFQGTARASASTTIVDVSYPSIYSTRWSSNPQGSDTILETDEGKDIYFIINTDNVPDGTKLAVIITSGPIANNVGSIDFVNYQYRQDVTIYGNAAVVKVSIAADQLTENREQFYGLLIDQAGTALSNSWMYINDTSKTPAPTYTMGWYSNSAGTTPISTINEGSTAWLIVRTTNVPDGTTLSIRPDMRVSQDDFTDNALNREAVIQNNIARVSYPIKADNMTEGDETFTVQVYTSDDYYNAKAWAIITVIDTSRETVITVPYEYNGKSVIVSELVKKLLGRAPYSDERFRVVVPWNVNLLGFPEVVGRKYLRQEVIPGGGLMGGDGAKFFYEDTFWGPYAGLDLTTMPNSGLVTVDVYGTVIGGPIQLYFGYDPRYLDNTVVFGNLGVDYMSYPNMLITANGASRVTNFYDDPPVNPRKVHNVAICGNNGFNLIVRDGAMVSGHGGAVSLALGAVQDFVYGDFIFDASGNIVGMTEGSFQYRKFNKEGSGGDALSNTTSGTIKYNVMGSGILTGGGGCGGAGGGLLAGSTTHEVPLSAYYAGLGGGGAPYGGALYRFDGWSGDPVCPAKYSRIGSFTAGRRLGDTGSEGYYSKFSAGSADLKTPGGCAGRYQYGNDRKGYGWDYEPNIGGAPGQDGRYGITYRYQDYRWYGNKIVVYTAEERAAASVPGKAGNVTYFSVITHDPNLT